MTEDKTRVFLAEDDENLGNLLKDSLEMEDFDVNLFKDGDEGWQAFNKGEFDICILDVMMPKKDGYALAKEIRKVDNQVPILFLTAKSMNQDKINGFAAGADDYVTKPFSTEELVLRINAIMRRVRVGQGTDEGQTVFQIGAYQFNYNDRQLSNGEESKKLTTKESELLRLLCIHKNAVLERDVALKSVWGNDNYFTGRSMDVYITKLRKYLAGDPGIQIMNIHGIGFKFVVKED